VIWWLARIAGSAFAIWFLRGLWVASQRPRLTYRSHEVVKAGMFITVDRQQLVPPWLSERETWLVHSFGPPTREGDGYQARDDYGNCTSLGHRIKALKVTIEARDEQLREISK
jgi:hypothetical protein